MDLFEEGFSSLVSKVIAECGRRRTLFLFDGFTVVQNKILLKSGCYPTWLEEYADDEGALLLSALESGKKELRRKVRSQLEEGDSFALPYEMAILVESAIRDAVEDSREDPEEDLLRVVVVSNNLFARANGAPTPFSDADMERLCSFYEEAEDGEPSGSAGLLEKLYASVSCCGGYYLATRVRIDEERLDAKTVHLMGCSERVGVQATPLYPTLEIDTADFIAYCCEASCGKATRRSIVQGEADRTSSHADNASALISFLNAIRVDCEYLSSIPEPAGRRQPDCLSDLLGYLRKYWGRRASFRGLKIYSNPSRNNEMTEISQGEVSCFIVEQALAAMNGDSYRDTLITAPTGAGKSLLFQLPAIYLAEKYKRVTLVVEPLIALMRDQVSSLEKRGVKGVAYLNSELTFEDRMRVGAKIESGEVSILYLSPELLLGSSLENILRGRELGLVVVDEVHTVTSWGRDFRPDYWYLGSYLAKYRASGRVFPLFCLTATAVYGGKDDMVKKTVEDLNLVSPRLLLGNPRRDDISFDIRVREKGDYVGGMDEIKAEVACDAIAGFVEKDAHSIVYCPYAKQVDSIVDRYGDGGCKVLAYHGKMEKETKKIVEGSFTSGSCRVLVSTKAYGMGIDVDDITNIYHLAPTGSLSDYVQEIGRGARDKNLSATASIDYFPGDTKYANMLYGMSRFYDWQINAIMRKLYDVYRAQPADKRSRNFLVSPASFAHIFPGEEGDRRVNRTKSALMMIAQDLKVRYGFPVVIIKPKVSLTKCFVSIKNEIEDEFTSRYGQYLQLKRKGSVHTEHRGNQSAVRVSDGGSVYSLEAGRMWEEEFSQFSFDDFKRRLFSGLLLGFDAGRGVAPRCRLKITYTYNEEKTARLLRGYAAAVRDALMDVARDGSFKEDAFVRSFKESLRRARLSVPPHPKSVLEGLIVVIGEQTGDLRFVYRYNSGRDKGSSTHVYCKARCSEFFDFDEKIMRLYEGIRPSGNAEGENCCVRYIALPSSGTVSTKIQMAEFLETLGLATFEMRGGDDPEIFVRLNDPEKLRDLTKDGAYKNKVLKDMSERHKYTAHITEGFFTTSMGDEKRWDLIEEYFLGNDAYVAKQVGIETQLEDGETIERKVLYRGTGKIGDGSNADLEPLEEKPVSEPMRDKDEITVVNEGTVQDAPLFRVWRKLAGLNLQAVEFECVEQLRGLTRGSNYEHPYMGTCLKIVESQLELHPVLMWPESKVLLFDRAHAEERDAAGELGWSCYVLGDQNVANNLAAQIKRPMM